MFSGRYHIISNASIVINYILFIIMFLYITDWPHVFLFVVLNYAFNLRISCVMEPLFVSSILMRLFCNAFLCFHTISWSFLYKLNFCFSGIDTTLKVIFSKTIESCRAKYSVQGSIL